LSKRPDKRYFQSAKAAREKGLEFALKGQLRKALDFFNIAIELDSNQWENYRFKGITYARLGQHLLAIKNLNIAIQLNPHCDKCLFECGMTKMFANQLEAALQDLSECVKKDKENVGAYSARAGIFTRKGLYHKALKDIETALSLYPENPTYLHNRAVILTGLGRYREAIQDYERVIELNPESGGSYNNLAWLLSTVIDPAVRNCRKAIFYARKAVRIDRNESWMDTLAAAYAECRDFEKAIGIETEAYKASKPPNENFHQRIEIYKMRRTYVEWRTERNLSVQ
jgi:tetratricopeptide (TPR) repeat protein